MWPDMGLPGRCNSYWWLLSIDSIEIPKHLTNNLPTHCLRMGEIMNMNSHIQLHIHMFTSCLKSGTGQTVDLKPTEKEQKWSWWRPISVDYQLQRISRSGLNRIALFCLQMVLCLPAGGRGRKKKAECHFLFRPQRSTKGGWWLRSISWRWQVDENVTLISQNPKQALFAPPQCSSSQILTQFRIIWLENSADAFIRDIGCG